MGNEKETMIPPQTAALMIAEHLLDLFFLLSLSLLEQTAGEGTYMYMYTCAYILLWKSEYFAVKTLSLEQGT